MKKQGNLFITLFMAMILTLSATLPSMVALAENENTNQSEYYKNSVVPRFEEIISFKNVKMSEMNIRTGKTSIPCYTFSYTYNFSDKSEASFYEDDIEAYEKLLTDSGWKLSEEDGYRTTGGKIIKKYTDYFGAWVSTTADIIPEKLFRKLVFQIQYERNCTPVYLSDGTYGYTPIEDPNIIRGKGWYTYPVILMQSKSGKKSVVPLAKLSEYERLGWVEASEIQIYRPGNKPKIISKHQLEEYQKTGWYDYPVIKIYSSDGTSKVVPESESGTWKAKGWFDDSETLVKMYSSDGQKCLLMPESKSDNYKNNGWIDSREKITIYSPNGQKSTIAKYELQGYKKLGWYDYPVTTMYAPDGRTQIVATKDVLMWEMEGWIKPNDKIRIYSPDGRTSTILKYQLQNYKSVGWYDYPVTTMFAPDGRTLVVAKSDVSAWENVGWTDMMKKITIYSLDGRTSEIYRYQLQDYQNVGWSLNKPIAKYSLSDETARNLLLEYLNSCILRPSTLEIYNLYIVAKHEKDGHIYQITFFVDYSAMNHIGGYSREKKLISVYRNIYTGETNVSYD